MYRSDFKRQFLVVVRAFKVQKIRKGLCLRRAEEWCRRPPRVFVVFKIFLRRIQIKFYKNVFLGDNE